MSHLYIYKKNNPAPPIIEEITIKYKKYTQYLFRKELKYHEDLYACIVKQHNKLLRSKSFLRFLDSFEIYGLSTLAGGLLDQQQKLKTLHNLLIDPLDESIIESIRVNMYVSIFTLISLYSEIFSCTTHIVKEMMEEQLKKLL